MMEPAQSPDSETFVGLKQASQILKVSVETLLEWNNNNILKPIITKEGEVGYKRDQLDKFLSIQKTSLNVNEAAPVIKQETQLDQVVLTTPKLLPQEETTLVNNDGLETTQKPEMSKTVGLQPFAIFSTFVAAGVLIAVLLF